MYLWVHTPDGLRLQKFEPEPPRRPTHEPLPGSPAEQPFPGTPQPIPHPDVPVAPGQPFPRPATGPREGGSGGKGR